MRVAIGDVNSVMIGDVLSDEGFSVVVECRILKVS